MPTSKPFLNEFTTRKKYGIPSRNFMKKNVLCEKGDEITRFDGTYVRESRENTHLIMSMPYCTSISYYN